MQISEEHLAIIESEINTYQLELNDPDTKEETLGQLKSIIAKTQSNGWYFSDYVLTKYAHEMLEQNLQDDALPALSALAKDKYKEAWIYSNLGWIYIHKNQMQEAWININIAAKMGDAWSQFALGKTLYLGCAEINLPPDQGAGLMWIQRSADQDFDEAKAFMISNSH